MKNLGLASILFCWAGLIFLIRKWKGNMSMTFSQHAAQYKSSAIYYFFLFAIFLPFFYWFLIDWFASEFHLGILFKLLVTVCCVALLVAATVPETVGTKVKVHRFAAFTMTDCMLLTLLVVVFSSFISTPARVLAGLSALYMTVTIVILWDTKARHPKVLLYQAAYVATFHLSILAATYIRLTTGSIIR